MQNTQKTQNAPFESARRAPDLYVEGLVPFLLIVVFPCVNEEKHASIPMFFHLFS